MCEHNSSKYQSLASKNYTILEKDGAIFLRYKQENSKLVLVQLECGKTEEFKINDHPTDDKYAFSLFGPTLCAKKSEDKNTGISFGSVLCILFFIGVIIYLIGGFCFKRFITGAQGIEQIPNVEFWKTVPGLMKKSIDEQPGLP
ncbi:DgyrCDS13855 [Dimorphilus gyrociliatus]|uniref:DgyrCDS13855 n=1 Tax=Dimorphilus gyrociliatus TaxID=2664684 RepID=A0A7I8WBX2_9ANNE|nr:DgyrCDS13855 [Dimorphilus gyrociliatus]